MHCNVPSEIQGYKRTSVVPRLTTGIEAVPWCTRTKAEEASSPEGRPDSEDSNNTTLIAYWVEHVAGTNFIDPPGIR